MRALKGLALFLVVTLSLAWVPSVAKADGCFTNRAFYGVQSYNYTPTYSYQKTYAVPYANYVPTYQQTYYYTPKVVEAIVQPDYYYSAGATANAKVIGDILKLLEKQIERNQQQPNPAVPYQQPLPPQGPGPEGSVQPGKVQQYPQTPMVPLNNTPQIEVVPHQQGAGSYQEPKLLAVVNKSCARCHSDGKASGGLVLVRNNQLAPLTEGQWWKAFAQVSIGEMPQGGKPLADDETVLFYQAAKAAEKLAKR